MALICYTVSWMDDDIKPSLLSSKAVLFIYVELSEYFCYTYVHTYILKNPLSCSSSSLFVWLSSKEVNVWDEWCWWLAGIVVVLCWADTEQMGLSLCGSPEHSCTAWALKDDQSCRPVQIWAPCGWFLPHSTFNSSLKVAYLKNSRKKILNNAHEVKVGKGIAVIQTKEDWSKCTCFWGLG